MPSTYAHRRFGADVLALLPDGLRATLEQHRELYDIGLHGPAAAGGHAHSQCQSGSNDCNILEFHAKYSFDLFSFFSFQPNQPGGRVVEVDYTQDSTKNQGLCRHFSR